MTVNNRTKIYWARTGPATIFGANWQVRKELSDLEAEDLFDGVWTSSIEPSIRSARRVSPVEAQRLIPDDGRKDFFDPGQEHREFSLGGTTLLAQFDSFNNELTQMWHLKAAPKSRDDVKVVLTRSKSQQTLPTMEELERFDRASLAELIGISVTAILLKL